MVEPVYSALKAHLTQLVAIDSTSSKSNLPLIEWLETRLLALGASCQRQEYVDAKNTRKINLLAHFGKGRAELALVGHTDCVPFDDAWSEALTLTERDQKWFGRGSCDTKAFIACAMLAAERARFVKPLSLIFTADEEVGCVGAKHLVEDGLGAAKYAIVGEPTSLRPIRANKGYCLAEVEVLGKEGHSAYPESGASAIFRAGRFLQRLETWATTELRAHTHTHFVPPYTTVNVGVIQGGTAKNVIPGRCVFTVEWRPIPTQKPDIVARQLENCVRELSELEPGFTAHVRVLRQDAGVDTPETSEIVQFLARRSGNAPDTVSFGTEAPYMTQLGAQAVVFGPGDIRVAHQTGEFVPVAEILRCHEMLVEAIEHFCR